MVVCVCQGQANKWIKAMEAAAGIEVVKANDKDLLRTMENSIRFGRPVRSWKPLATTPSPLSAVIHKIWLETVTLNIEHICLYAEHRHDDSGHLLVSMLLCVHVIPWNGIANVCLQVLLEDLGEGSLEAALEPLLLRATFKQGGSEVIKLGDNIIPYHQDFK